MLSKIIYETQFNVFIVNFEEENKMKLILIGIMGVGKTHR